MDIQNISALTLQLESLGFENMSYPLNKRISFKPQTFHLLQKFEKRKDLLSFQLYFERGSEQSIYSLVYFDATLQKQQEIIDTTINGVNLIKLETAMSVIDWKNAFDFITKKKMNLEDKTSWEREQMVEHVIDDLFAMEKTDEGKVVADELKFKHWAGIPYQDLFDNISPLKYKSAINQRFYIADGQPGITVNEAYRFLQNKWLEKTIQAKRKSSTDEKGEEVAEEQPASSVNSLIKKRQIKSSKKATAKR